MPTRLKEHKVPVEFNPTPLTVVSIEDPDLYEQAVERLDDLIVTVTHDLSGVEVYAFLESSGTSGRIASGENKRLEFNRRLTVIFVEKG